MKLHISIYTWLIWIVAYFNHSLKPICFLFLLLTIHECSHCLMAAFFKCQITSIAIYPFGLCAEIPTLRYQRKTVQLCVFMAGPLIHCFTPLILRALLSCHFLSKAFFEWCIQINLQLLFFNCLPIYPLDGSGLLSSCLNSVLPFKKTMEWTHWISIISIFSFFIFVIKHTASSMLIAFLLLTINIKQLFNMNETMHDAVLYRLTRGNKGAICVHNKNDFYLYRHNYYLTKEGLVDESQHLFEFLDKNQSH